VVIPLILQVVATVGLTGWLSWRNSNRTVHDLTNQLIEQAIARVEQRVETFGFASDNLPPKANEQTPLTVAEMRMFLQGLNFTELGLIAIVEGSGKIIATCRNCQIKLLKPQKRLNYPWQGRSNIYKLIISRFRESSAVNRTVLRSMVGGNFCK